MKLQTPISLMIVTLAAGVLGVSACNQRSPSNTASTSTPATTPPATTATTPPAMTTADKASEATNKVAEAVDDAAITTKVKTALLAEPGLKSLEISVDTRDGTVTLTGKVDSPDQRDRAKQVAQTTGGVKGVVDNLAVKSS